MELSEHIKTANVEDVTLRRPFHPALRGTLCVTSHHLLFSDRKDEASWQLLILLKNIDAIEKSIENLFGYPRAVGSSGTITIKCKDLLVLQLEIPGMEECLNIASSIEALSSLESMTEMYPFFYRPSHLTLHGPWGLSSTEQYYKQTERLWDRWRVSKVNSDYSVCPSYPSAVIVPREVDDDKLIRSARFRQGGRFPVLSYCHHRNGMVIMRSSQPLTGANKKRCKEDELLLQAVIDGSELGYIIDLRSAQQAQQARMTGGGFESKSCYSHWKRIHRHHERGKVVQESLTKLVEVCSDPSHSVDRWLSKLENSKWLSHVHSALSTAGLVVECVERDGHSVLVHGSEGTDNTLLVSSLAQLVLDPASRTVTGFLCLLEREWIQAGHPFQQRCAHSAYSHARLKQECPIFLLLLDCVWQVWRQFPLALEFSEALLLRLAQEVYASNYGTFLCNSEQERCAAGVKENTHCLFQSLLKPDIEEQYLNPLYEPTDLAIWPSVHPQSLQLWTGMFLRWTEYAQNMEEAREEVWSIVKEHRERAGPDRTNNTLSTHCDTLTPFENLMDELTIL
ncbi:myotubularin-related protein 9-like isoform X1 [Sinocyclocheilus rhinocerous]|uniref:Myotubularin-related protein 9-like n=1 Tax=Sinocyclocheilus rhinocerous TaxID=307959 RepID=A0A673L8C2_9TELE|nr:PREDICTED: myotubularin-related protein 9-like isoform X1 [Sinocyclocheilus rhinocerous]